VLLHTGPVRCEIFCTQHLLGGGLAEKAQLHDLLGLVTLFSVGLYEWVVFITTACVRQCIVFAAATNNARNIVVFLLLILHVTYGACVEVYSSLAHNTRRGSLTITRVSTVSSMQPFYVCILWAFCTHFYDAQ
jgi:hypothetical protein